MDRRLLDDAEDDEAESPDAQHVPNLSPADLSGDRENLRKSA